MAMLTVRRQGNFHPTPPDYHSLHRAKLLYFNSRPSLVVYRQNYFPISVYIVTLKNYTISSFNINMKRSILIIFCLLSISTFTQVSSNGRLSVFMEGRIIDFNYIRNNINFVDFVTDSKIADVHVIISRIQTGGGGYEYTLAYYGKDFEQLGDFSLSCITYSFESKFQTREKMAKTLTAGLLPYVNEKNGAANISITQIAREDSESDEVSNNTDTATIDPWKNWVFRIGLRAGLSGEEQKKNTNYSMDFEGKKITDEWKFQTNYNYNRRESKITNIEDGVEEIINSLRLNKNLNIQFVYSMSSRWSWGVFLQATQSTYQNNKAKVGFTPALQYNFFPWSEVDRRSFTVTYKVGPSYNEYYETTILDKDLEWLWSESLEIRLEKEEIWGDLEVFLKGGHYFPKFEHYYYRAGFDISFRISKGLSFTVELETEKILNQRYLPESELSLEDLLLNIRKPPTSFEYSVQIGLRFQFGSFFNNVVNERFGSRYYR